MLTYRHEPTGAHLETEAQALDSGREFEEVKFRTPVVGLTATAFKAVNDSPAFDVQNVHLYTGGVPNPDEISVAIRPDGLGGGYLSIKTDAHTHVYVPMEMARAIAEAMR